MRPYLVFLLIKKKTTTNKKHSMLTQIQFNYVVHIFSLRTSNSIQMKASHSMQSSKEIQFPWNAIESEMKKKMHVYFLVAFSNDNVISFACFSAILSYSELLNYEFFSYYCCPHRI